MATNNAINQASDTLTATTVYSTTFDTNVTAAGVTLAGTTLAADGTDAAINIVITPKGTGVISTANNIYAAGISFDSGTNTMANYAARNTWTPQFSFAGGTTGITYSTQTGYYSRIGDIIYFSAVIVLTSKGSSSGNLWLQNLPATPAITGQAFSALLSNVTYANGTYLVGQTSTSGYMTFTYTDNASAPEGTITNTMCDNDLILRCGGLYWV